MAGPRIHAAEDEPAEEIESASEDVTKLATYNVKADRLEDFGFRVRGALPSPFSSGSITVFAVYPNTAAAKAGLRPGDRVLTSDGRSASFSIFSISKWRRFQQAKWSQVAAGKTSVKWVLEVQSATDPAPRTVTLVIPTPAPHWGASKWQPPLGRPEATVAEAGPLAELSRTVLNNGVWVFADGRGMGLTDAHAKMPPLGAPFLGYQWQLRVGTRVHTVFVTQARGQTDIVFTTSEPKSGTYEFRTSPSGALDRARARLPRKRWQELEVDDARLAFAAELDFWLNQVGKVTARWPLEVKPDAVAAGTYVAVTGDTTAGPPPLPPTEKTAKATGKIAPEVLKLPVATDEQRTLFADAYGRLGADADQWAYTQTYQTLESKRKYTIRVDPSKPEGRQCTLLKVEGKPPTADDIKAWHDSGQDMPATLGDLPPLDRIIDTRDLRIFADEPAAVVFELPIRSTSADFPADRFQALFRVNKARRAFEDIRVKLRGAVPIVGIVKLAEAGITLRFESLDPALAPQPVELKAGGAVSILLVKISRSFEAKRSEFTRVAPVAKPVAESTL